MPLLLSTQVSIEWPYPSLCCTLTLDAVMINVHAQIFSTDGLALNCVTTLPTAGLCPSWSATAPDKSVLHELTFQTAYQSVNAALAGHPTG